MSNEQEEKEMKCFHHSDADGLCAAYWVKKRYPSMVESDFIKMNYGSNIDWLSKVSKDEHVSFNALNRASSISTEKK